MQNDYGAPPDNWPMMTLVFTSEACAILRYSDETIRKMCAAGVLRQVGTRITVLSILDLLEGKTTWPPVKEPQGERSTRERTTTTPKQNSTNGRSGTKAKRSESKAGTKIRRAVNLKR